MSCQTSSLNFSTQARPLTVSPHWRMPRPHQSPLSSKKTLLTTPTFELLMKLTLQLLLLGLMLWILGMNWISFRTSSYQEFRELWCHLYRRNPSDFEILRKQGSTPLPLCPLMSLREVWCLRLSETRWMKKSLTSNGTSLTSSKRNWVRKRFCTSWVRLSYGTQTTFKSTTHEMMLSF